MSGAAPRHLPFLEQDVAHEAAARGHQQQHPGHEHAAQYARRAMRVPVAPVRVVVFVLVLVLLCAAAMRLRGSLPWSRSERVGLVWRLRWYVALQRRVLGQKAVSNHRLAVGGSLGEELGRHPTIPQREHVGVDGRVHLPGEHRRGFEGLVTQEGDVEHHWAAVELRPKRRPVLVGVPVQLWPLDEAQVVGDEGRTEGRVDGRGLQHGFVGEERVLH
mmetsp:Transcript_20593/g.35143  ORF Transcript_20593/g.35143 Transcript_20593/m.35143 type:complete len:217 (-) Transcript_20593:890-1540(-)